MAGFSILSEVLGGFIVVFIILLAVLFLFTRINVYIVEAEDIATFNAMKSAIIKVSEGEGVQTVSPLRIKTNDKTNAYYGIFYINPALAKRIVNMGKDGYYKIDDNSVFELKNCELLRNDNCICFVRFITNFGPYSLPSYPNNMFTLNDVRDYNEIYVSSPDDVKEYFGYLLGYYFSEGYPSGATCTLPDINGNTLACSGVNPYSESHRCSDMNPPVAEHIISSVKVYSCLPVATSPSTGGLGCTTSDGSPCYLKDKDGNYVLWFGASGRDINAETITISRVGDGIKIDSSDYGVSGEFKGISECNCTDNRDCADMPFRWVCYSSFIWHCAPVPIP